MIDSFGDFKALLPINHCLMEGVEMWGNMVGHIQREGLQRGKSYGKMVPRARERHRETKEKMEKGQVASVGGAETESGNTGAGLLSAWGSECATGMMTSKDFLSGVFFIHRPTYWGCAAFGLRFSFLLWADQSTVAKLSLKVGMSHRLSTCPQTGISWSGSAGTGCGSCAWWDSSHSSHTSCSWCFAECCGEKNPGEKNKQTQKKTKSILKLCAQCVGKNYERHLFSDRGAYLAALACVHSIMETRRNVSTDFAKQDHPTWLWNEWIRVAIQLKTR